MPVCVCVCVRACVRVFSPVSVCDTSFDLLPISFLISFLISFIHFWSPFQCLFVTSGVGKARALFSRHVLPETELVLIHLHISICYHQNHHLLSLSSKLNSFHLSEWAFVCVCPFCRFFCFSECVSVPFVCACLMLNLSNFRIWTYLKLWTFLSFLVFEFFLSLSAPILTFPWLLIPICLCSAGNCYFRSPHFRSKSTLENFLWNKKLFPLSQVCFFSFRLGKKHFSKSSFNQR